MKKLAAILTVLILMWGGIALADSGSLSTPRDVQPTQATSIDWEFNLGTRSNAVTGRHRWKASDGTVIYLPGSSRGGWINWSLRNWTIDSVPGVDNSDCVGVDDPDDCCTGVGAGTCDDYVPMLNDDCTAAGEPSPCCTGLDAGVCEGWSDTALFDCGSSACDGYILGVGLRTLILNQWKKVYCPGCNITF